MRRSPRVLAAPLLLAACAGPPPAAPETPPLSYPPAAAARVLRIAIAEWQDWGGVTRDAWADSPGNIAADSPGTIAAGSPAGVAPETPAQEAAPTNFPRVLAYWRAVPRDYGAIAENRARYAATLAGQGDGPLWAGQAWSAAFISWVFRTAGVDAPEFPPNATHALYLDALLAQAARWPAAAPFLPHAPEDRAPAPGDLLCFDRSPAPLIHWRDRLAETGQVRAMHCDIVVGIAPGVVDAIGGNVLDAVTLTRFPADATGRLTPPPPGRRPMLLVMESRLGQWPPWGARP